MDTTIEPSPSAFATRGRRQVAESPLKALEEIVFANPFITLRSAGARVGVSRDTAHRVRWRLVINGSLPAPGRGLNLDLNRERFRMWKAEHPQLGDWRPRAYRRYRPVSMTIKIGFPALNAGPDWQERVAVEWLTDVPKARIGVLDRVRVNS
jgi:hypothetical protein